MSDTDIEYSDTSELDDEFFKTAEVVMPPGKKSISLRLDEDVLNGMKEQGKTK